ncbi:MAG: glycosyltransferase [Geitlerinemataceae cyanobacterium]
MLVSILIDNYNYEKYLGEAIASALDCRDCDIDCNIDYDIEVIVVDDGSTDGSRQEIERFGDRITAVFQANGGQAAAINTGIAAAKGELVCLLDADDYFYPEKVARVVEQFEADRELGWVFHELNEVDRHGQGFERPHRGAIERRTQLDLRRSLRNGDPVTQWLPATTGLCFRRELLAEIGEIPEAFRVSADSFLRLAALFLAPGLLLPDRLAAHRSHGENLYEFRSDINVARMTLGMQTAYYVRERFPALQAFARKKFTFCLGRAIQYAGFRAAMNVPEMKCYLQRDRSLRFRLRALAYAAKGLLMRLRS